jgi:hypothetical protein
VASAPAALSVPPLLQAAIKKSIMNGILQWSFILKHGCEQ